MERDIYLKHKRHYRETGDLHPEILHEYYKEHNQDASLNLEPDEFSKYFSKFLFYLRTQPRLMGCERTIVERVLNYFDKQFNITKIYNTDTTLINEY